MADEFVKPRPPARAEDLHAMRAKVKANDKFAIARKSVEEGIKLVQENYNVDAESARIFVEWIHGNGGDHSAENPPKVSPLERLRKGCDPSSGNETYLDPSEAPPAAEEAPKKKKR